MGEALSPVACGQEAGGCGQCWAKLRPCMCGASWGQWHTAIMQRGMEGLGSPVPSELHGTHYCPWLVECGDEDLLWGGDGDEAAHVRGCSWGPVLLLPGLV